MKVGQKLKMDGDRTRYTVQGEDERFIVATKPHFETYMYTIIDKVRGVRGPINMTLGLPCDCNSPEGAEELLDFMRDETGGHEVWGVSHRNYVEITDSERAHIFADELGAKRSEE